MSEEALMCAHDPCACVATEGEFCSDYCKENEEVDEDVCGCGHTDCLAQAT